jgi:hypothetical protein
VLFGGFALLAAGFAFVVLRLERSTRIAAVLLPLQDTTAQLRQKLEAIGFGVFIPVFFVTSGVQFDLAALFSSPATILCIPIFLVALLLVRGVPALLYRPFVGSRRSVKYSPIAPRTLDHARWRSTR